MYAGVLHTSSHGESLSSFRINFASTEYENTDTLLSDSLTQGLNQLAIRKYLLYIEQRIMYRVVNPRVHNTLPRNEELLSSASFVFVKVATLWLETEGGCI